MSNGSEHADLEALSAYVDGEAPEWTDHVSECAACRAAADELRAVAAAVSVPVEPADRRAREAALRAALGEVGEPRPTAPPAVVPRRFQWRPNLAAVAAALVLVLGFSALLVMSRTRSDETTVAGPALESAPPAAGPMADSLAGAGLPPTDVGDVPDAATLAARVRPALTATTSAAAGAASARSSANSGTSSPGAPGAVAGGSGGQPAAAPTVNVTGTRPCEEQARGREPSLREVVYFATARRGQVPAVVLGFSTGPAPAPVTLLLLAQPGCSELLRASAGP